MSDEIEVPQEDTIKFGRPVSDAKSLVSGFDTASSLKAILFIILSGAYSMSYMYDVSTCFRLKGTSAHM